MSDGTRFYKVVSHENNGDTTVQYAAWQDKNAALFLLGEPATDGFTASNPDAAPDESTPRRATVLYIFKDVKHQEQLQKHLEAILNLDFMDELPYRPPIGDVDMSRFPGETFLLGALLT